MKSWQKLLIGLGLFGGLVAVLIMMQPPALETDLSQIGKGKFVIVHVSDSDLLVSTQIATAINEIASRYKRKDVLFVVAEKEAPDGAVFIKQNNAKVFQLWFYSPTGKRLKIIYGNGLTKESLSRIIDLTFGFIKG